LSCAETVLPSLRRYAGRGKSGAGEHLWGRDRPERRIGSAGRQRGTERAEARGVFELVRLVSCGSGDGRRTKLEICSGESRNDFHRPSTLWAEPRLEGSRERETVRFAF
jgi:hypothetical protein